MKERYDQYFDEMPCYLSVHDRDYRIIDANQRFREDFGERVGAYCYKAYKDRDEPCEGCPVEATFEDGKSHASEQILLTRNGKQVNVIVHTRPIRDKSGEIVSVMEMHTDIGRTKRLQASLQRSQARLHQLFEEVPCHISVQGTDLKIRHANRLFRETFGASVGDHCYEVYKHREEPCLVCPARETFEDGKARDHEEVVTSVTGKKMNMMCVTAPLFNEEGEPTAIIEMSTDITQMRQLQSQLASIGLLVGSISHGIKGLLNGLDGGIYLVNSGRHKGNEERVTKGWDMVQRNVDRIRSMVMDILYYAKDRELTLEEVDPATILEELEPGLLKKASDIDTKLEVDVARDAGTFQADALAVRATLQNLLENSLDACRADTSKPEHWLKVKVRREPPFMVFDVEDNGIGMDRETREKVFSLFFSSKGIKGTGLGLFISNKIVDKHGGSIVVQSEPDVGTKFIIRFPLEPRPSVPPTEGQTVVED